MGRGPATQGLREGGKREVGVSVSLSLSLPHASWASTLFLFFSL